MTFGASSYSINLDKYREGQIGSAKDETLTWLNPIEPQVLSTLVGGAATDGTYSYEIQVTSGPNVGQSYLVSIDRVAGVPASNAEIDDALRARAIELYSQLFEFTQDGGTPEKTLIQARSALFTFVVTNEAAPAPGTLAGAEESPAGATRLRGSTFMRRDDAADAGVLGKMATTSRGVLRPLVVGTTLAELIGVLMQGVAYPEQQTSNQLQVTSPEGTYVSVIKEGYPVVIAETAIAKTDTLFVRRNAVTPGEILGSVRNAADGGDTLDISSIAAPYEACAAGELCRIRLNIPLL